MLQNTEKQNKLLKIAQKQLIQSSSQKQQLFQQNQRLNNNDIQRQGSFAFQRTHKKCRQWSKAQDNMLIQLHNQKGNKWVQIGQFLKRTDNQVKNYYHSKLRKTFRKINRFIEVDLMMKQKPLKMNVLSKIMQTAETNYHCRAIQSQYSRGLTAFNLKNKIIQLSQIQENDSQFWTQNMVNIIKDIQEFNKQNQKESKAIKNDQINKYKAKQIKKLITENEKKECKIKSLNSSDTFTIENQIKPQIQQNNIQLKEKVHPFSAQQNITNSFPHPVNLQAYYMFNTPMFYQPIDSKVSNQVNSPSIFSQSSAFSFVGSPLNFNNANNQSMSLNYMNGNFMGFIIPNGFPNIN